MPKTNSTPKPPHKSVLLFTLHRQHPSLAHLTEQRDVCAVFFNLLFGVAFFPPYRFVVLFPVGEGVLMATDSDTSFARIG